MIAESRTASPEGPPTLFATPMPREDAHALVREIAASRRHFLRPKLLPFECELMVESFVRGEPRTCAICGAGTKGDCCAIATSQAIVYALCDTHDVPQGDPPYSDALALVQAGDGDTLLRVRLFERTARGWRWIEIGGDR